MWCCKMLNNSQDKQTVKCPCDGFSNEVCGLFKYEKHIRQIRKSNKLRLCTPAPQWTKWWTLNVMLPVKKPSL